MSAKRKPNPYALDVTRFIDSPSYELALLVHQETEAQRAIDALAFRAQHGNIPPPSNALMLGVGLYDLSAFKPWGEYAKSFDVLERCGTALGLPLGDVAKRISVELQPDNWEVIFWMGTWLQALDQATNIKAQMREQTQAIEREKEKRRQDRRSGGLAKNKEKAKAKEFVRAEWALHQHAYDRNKRAFARHYVGRILHELGVEVTHDFVSVKCLRGL